MEVKALMLVVWMVATEKGPVPVLQQAVPDVKISVCRAAIAGYMTLAAMRGFLVDGLCVPNNIATLEVPKGGESKQQVLPPPKVERIF